MNVDPRLLAMVSPKPKAKYGKLPKALRPTSTLAFEFTKGQRDELPGTLHVEVEDDYLPGGLSSLILKTMLLVQQMPRFRGLLLCFSLSTAEECLAKPWFLTSVPQFVVFFSGERAVRLP